MTLREQMDELRRHLIDAGWIENPIWGGWTRGSDPQTEDFDTWTALIIQSEAEEQAEIS